MEKNKDWEELEQWAENDKQTKIDTYKIDINDMDKNKNNVDKVIKFFGTTIKASTAFFIILGAILIFNILLLVDIGISNVKTMSNADINSILDLYGTIEKEIISKEVDENENGKYIFELKNNKEIRFTAIKNWGKISNDFTSQYQKYIFDNWNSDVKSKFEVSESIDENGMLTYENYISIEETSQISEATEYLIDFLEYAEKWNKENKIIKVWQQKEGQFIVPIKVYIKDKEKMIHPYHAMFVTADDIRNEVK